MNKKRIVTNDGQQYHYCGDGQFTDGTNYATYAELAGNIAYVDMGDETPTNRNADPKGLAERYLEEWPVLSDEVAEEMARIALIALEDGDSTGLESICRRLSTTDRLALLDWEEVMSTALDLAENYD